MPILQQIFQLVQHIRFSIWIVPILFLTVLTYYLEKYTKYKTSWKIVGLATIFAVIEPFLNNVIGSIFLLVAIGIASVKSLNVLKFQKLNLGKTKDIVEILLTIGVIVPLLAYLDQKIGISTTWILIAYNTAGSLLVLIYLIIGKSIRNYIPQHGRLVYTVVVVGSLFLPANLALKNFGCMSSLFACSENPLIYMGIVFQMIGNTLLGLAVILLIREAKIRGMRIKPEEEYEKQTLPLKHRLKKGYSYLIDEEDGKKSLEVFSQYIKNKYHGLGITRTKPENIRFEYGLRTTPLLWMTTAETKEKTIRPKDTERLLLIIKNFVSEDSRPILLLQRLDYLITENNFESILKFTHELNDSIMASDCILLVSMNLDTLTKEQRSQLTQELRHIDEGDQVILNEPLYALLQFVHSENNDGRRPSFRNITDSFSITKTTTRNRIRDLKSKGLLRVIEEGKYKLLEVTSDGDSIMKNPVGPRGW